MGYGEVPVDWYRNSFSPNFHSLYWEEGGERKAQLALEMLRPRGDEKVLDLACATGRRTLELAREGYIVTGVDIRGELLEVAACEAIQEDLVLPYFVESDPRDLEFDKEFDIVLSLGGGAFGFFEYDEDDRRAFKAVARALCPGGRLLMQIPNVLRVESHLPERTWVSCKESIDLIEQEWNPETRRIDATRTCLLNCENLDEAEPQIFRRRLYSIDELRTILGKLGLRLGNVYDEIGMPCAPTVAHKELYVEARR